MNNLAIVSQVILERAEEPDAMGCHPNLTVWSDKVVYFYKKLLLNCGVYVKFWFVN